MKNVNTAQHIEEQPMELTQRGKRFRAAGFLLAAVALLGVTHTPEHIGDSLSRLGNAYSQDEINNMPKMQFAVGEGDGTNKFVNIADPNIDQDAVTELNDYVRAQGTAHDSNGNPTLRVGQSVEVPIAPGQIPSQPIK